MKKKILWIAVTIIFIVILILINIFLNNQNQDMLGKNNEQTMNNNKIEEVSKMELLKVTSENFNTEVLESDRTVLVDFYADWCGPCKMLSPIVEEIAKENDDIKVVKINVDNAQDLAIKYQVMSIPTLVVIKNGNVANKTVGLVDKATILNMVK